MHGERTSPGSIAPTRRSAGLRKYSIPTCMFARLTWKSRISRFDQVADDQVAGILLLSSGSTAGSTTFAF